MRIITHNGSFHADELVAIAILRAFTPNWYMADIVRTRDKEIIAEGKKDRDNIIIDVGGEYNLEYKMFDHHQNDPHLTKPNGDLYASAGLVWDGLKNQGIYDQTEEWQVAKRKIDDFVENVDRSDNGVKVAGWSFSMSVHKCNPVDTADFDERFNTLVSILTDILSLVSVGEIDDIAHAFEYHPTVQKWTSEFTGALEDSERRIRKVMQTATDLLVLDRYEPALLEIAHEAPESVKFSVYPNPASEWMIQQIPVAPKSFEGRLKFPEKWWSLRDSELESETGVPGSIFVHKFGFIGANKTSEGAVAMAKLAISLA